MKTKTLALLLSTALTLTLLSGCGSKNENPVTEKQEDTTENSTPEIVNIEDEEEKEEDSSIVTRPTHYDILPEVANASIADGTIYQIADMVFYDDYRMSVDDVKKTVENSKTGAYCEDISDNPDRPYLAVYDEHGYDVIAILEWGYVDPAKSEFPVPEAGMYLRYVLPSMYAQENMGIENSIYCGGGYIFDENGLFYSDTKTYDDFVAELESLGCTRVNELPSSSSLTADDKGYYEDVNGEKRRICFCLNDNYWTGKTNSDGTVIVNPVRGEVYFDENGKLISYEN